MRGESMKGKSKKSTYSTTFGVDPSKKSTYSTTFDVDPKKYEQKKYPERGSNPHDVAIGGF